MPTPRLIYPMLSGFLLGDAFSCHDGVRCYPAIRLSDSEKYILKVISIPASEVQLEALLITGAVSDKDAARSYFHRQAEEILQQVQILHQLSHQEGFLPYVDAQIVTKEEGIGYDVYLLSSFKRSFEKLLQSNTLSKRGSMDRILELCAALSACRRSGYLYADLKPGNIFYNEETGCRIGDLGFAAMDSLAYTALPQKYHSPYTAPEMQDDFAVLNATLDVYALGMLLYQIYNDGILPEERPNTQEPLLPPVYADYELSEIILKACDPKPENRWSDPTAFAEALVAYMQRNDVADVPIIPVAPEEVPEATEEFLPEPDEMQLQEELDALQEEDELLYPAELSDPIDAEQGQDLDVMLAQADELIAHDLPAPAVAPAPVEVPMPEPIVLEVETEEPEEAIAEEPEEAEEAEIAEPSAEAAPDDHEETAEAVIMPAAETEEIPEAVAQEEAPEEKVPFRFPRKIAVIVLILALLAAFVMGGVYYYRNYYLQHIDSMTLDYRDDRVIVHIQSDIDDSLLTVIRSDSYGNSVQASVAAGVAIFEDLQPQTRYTIRVEISGVHKLTGSTSQSFSTPARTHILSFQAGIGDRDGSVLLNLTTTGPQVDAWTVTYEAEGEQPRTATFSGNLLQLDDLTVGKKYTFTLSASDGRQISGENTVTYLATDILLAQSLQILGCGGGTLTVQWAQPEGYQVDSWTLHCYNANGFSQIVTTDQLEYTFTGLTHDIPCTVDITAEGMCQSATITVSANPITVHEFVCNMTESMQLRVSWNFTGGRPEDGWMLHYSIDGASWQSVQAPENAVLLPAIPGAQYQFRLEMDSERLLFGGEGSYTLPEPQQFQGFGISSENTLWQTALVPREEGWTFADLTMTEQFASGDQIGIVAQCSEAVENNSQLVIVQFAVYDENGILVQESSSSVAWDELWADNICTLLLPFGIDTPGSYTLHIFISGMLAYSQGIYVQ